MAGEGQSSEKEMGLASQNPLSPHIHWATLGSWTFQGSLIYLPPGILTPTYKYLGCHVASLALYSSWPQLGATPIPHRSPALTLIAIEKLSLLASSNGCEECGQEALMLAVSRCGSLGSAQKGLV